jgi:hypothetical protein
MPQCQFPIFCCFCVSKKLYRQYSRNWTKQRPKLLFFPDEGRGPKESRRGARGHAHQVVAHPPSWPRQGVVSPPWPSDAAPPPIKNPPKENPKTIGIFPRTVPQCCRHRRPISGDRSLCSGTLSGRGSAPGAISIGLHHHLHRLHRPHRHLHRRCCLL